MTGHDMTETFLFKKKCIVVAEISANHRQKLSLAQQLIRKAKECGVDAVKFQAYTPDTLTINAASPLFRIRHPRWGGQTLYRLYQKAYTPWKWFPSLVRTASREGIAFFATAFDKSSVDFLEDLGVPVHKIASFEIVDIPLIEYAARTGKPLIISTGMATLREIREALTAARSQGCRDITLLKCVSSYPARPRDMHLSTIPHMKDKFKCRVGISDHSLMPAVSLGAVALGASLIEKHFTLSRKTSSPDAFFSIEPDELKALVINAQAVYEARGQVH
jgi:pseudaminic acid synthase